MRKIKLFVILASAILATVNPVKAYAVDEELPTSVLIEEIAPEPPTPPKDYKSYDGGTTLDGADYDVNGGFGIDYVSLMHAAYDLGYEDGYIEGRTNSHDLVFLLGLIIFLCVGFNVMTLIYLYKVKRAQEDDYEEEPDAAEGFDPGMLE